MKHKIFGLLLAAVLLLLVGCDVIAPDDRIIRQKAIDPVKTVLLEDYTGWRCTNCPDAANVAHELQEAYGVNVVVVSLHPDCYWTKPGGAALDLRSAAADVYYQYFGAPTDFPIGMVDRVAFDNSPWLVFPRWTTHVKERLALPQPFEFNLSYSVDPATRQVTVDAVVTAGDIYSGNLSYQLLLTEDSIVGPQYVGGVVEPNYVHNHVLRDALNGSWGENVMIPTVGNTTTLSSTYTIGSSYVLGNCNLVGFLYDTDTKEIIAVDSKRITPENVFPDNLFEVYYYLDGDTIEIGDGDTVVLDSFYLDPILLEDKFLFDGYIQNINSEVGFKLEVNVTRDDPSDGTTDELCLTPSCIPTNGQTMQTFRYDATILPGARSAFYAHCSPKTAGDYTIVYTFHPQGAETPKVTATVIYRYNP